jgi:hypothetical protein
MPTDAPEFARSDTVAPRVKLATVEIVAHTMRELIQVNLVQ